jgi:predicted phosphodiesterase
LKRPVLSWRRIARQVAAGIGPRGPQEGVRLLHVSDIHNSIRGFRLAAALARVLAPDLVLSTGDLSGTGGFPEAVLLRALWRIREPQVLAPGNHDSAVTNRVLRRMGAAVLDRPQLVEVSGVRVWGFPDPNRSPLFGPPYNLELARQAARTIRPPEGAGPYLIAVHDNAMVEHPPPEAGMVLSGHGHVPKVERRGGVVLLRCGSTGGGGPFGGPLQAAVVDLALPEHRPLHVWLLETDGRTLSVAEASI